jgi:hypothetical protein
MLKGLLTGLKELEDNLQGSSYTVPMDYIINKIVNEIGKERPRFSEELKYPEGWEDSLTEKARTEKERDELIAGTRPSEEMEDWQARYDAERKGIPYELYRWTTGGTFILSNDKRYLILKRTGEKFFPVGGSLMKLVKDEK